jgi:hypothetical protein
LSGNDHLIVEDADGNQTNCSADDKNVLPSRRLLLMLDCSTPRGKRLLGTCVPRRRGPNVLEPATLLSCAHYLAAKVGTPLELVRIQPLDKTISFSFKLLEEHSG